MSKPGWTLLRSSSPGPLILKLRRTPLQVTLAVHQSEWLNGVTIAVARDAAFCFIYAANIDCQIVMGAHVVYFSPLTDKTVPHCVAFWLPGGYPELRGHALASNAAMVAAIAKHVAAGKPVWAECGGMMALFDQLTTLDGEIHAMWGVLPGSVALQERLAALGPQQLDVGGGTLRGHNFHYSICSTPLVPTARTQAAPGGKGRSEEKRCTRWGRSGPAIFMPGSHPARPLRPTCS